MSLDPFANAQPSFACSRTSKVKDRGKGKAAAGSVLKSTYLVMGQGLEAGKSSPQNSNNGYRPCEKCLTTLLILLSRLISGDFLVGPSNARRVGSMRYEVIAGMWDPRPLFRPPLPIYIWGPPAGVPLCNLHNYCAVL